MAELVLTIDGSRIDGIVGFYAEINRVFMADEDWQLGDSLDALDDMLRGGYGALKDAPGTVRLIWTHLEKSRADLGLAETRRWLTDKLAQPKRFNGALIRRQLDELEAGTGKTFFQTVLEILADHPGIRLES